MRQLPEKMQQDLAVGVTQFCYGWLIIRGDGVRLGLTNHDADLAFNGEVYRANSGISFSALDTRLGLTRHGAQATGVLGSPHISEEDLLAGVYDGSRFQLYLIDWQAPDNGLLLMDGSFDTVGHSEGRFQVTLRATGQQLNQVQGRVYQQQCDAVLGDSRCQVNLEQAAYHWRGTVHAISGDYLILPLLDFTAGWFQHGTIETASGRLLPIRFDETRDDQRYIQLWQDARPLVQAGETIQLRAGCDKSLRQCGDKFANSINFQGFASLSDEAVLVAVGS